MANLERVGIFSGTFDPVHNGHLVFARQAIQECELDRIVFLVEPEPRRKQNVMDYKHRLAMVELATLGESGMEALALNQPQFAIADTLPVLKSKFEESKLHFLLGDDMLEHMAQWPDIPELLKSVSLVIAARNNEQSSIESLVRQLQDIIGQPVEHFLIKNQGNDISSRTIRNNLQKHNQPLGLPKAVLEYIETNRLYL